jgi:MFS family permease
LVFFTAGAIVAAVADDFVVLLLGRTLQGMGGGGISTLTEIIVTDLVPLRVRGVWFGFIGGAVEIGTSIGPVIGGALVDNVPWVRKTFLDGFC